MYKIYFYRDRKGHSSVLEYLRELDEAKTKDSRINAMGIRRCVKALSTYGTKVGEPYVKHLSGEIWELRPIRNRILFAAWHNNSFVLLHYFMKETQKTPAKEIEKAKRELEDLIERGVEYDE
ncbi:MAG: type II toxin-antitoxin system RelE/ParE family toxin [Firmicutes bacterium]|nr:type II toxin-antitoxin system RelE/ParE family toxin [[Eubacterium] siraeum]MCM1487156.1 type II toxin-antitoxin system RelE/ParE family toxin [Bacillota bacterium]